MPIATAAPRHADPPRVLAGGPFFDDLVVGQVFADAPPVTLTAGHAALHSALTGDRMRLALDAGLSREVTGRGETLAHPMLVCNLAIGGSTGVSQRVRANLFYRGLVLERPVFIGDTLRTTAEVTGLRRNRPRPRREATGLVALRVRTVNQRDETVLDFWRCPMLPLRDPSAVTDWDAGFDAIPVDLDEARLVRAVPSGWNLEAHRRARPAGTAGPEDFAPGTIIDVEGRDTVTGAPELARMTLNIATAHADAAASPYRRRLVYGGHTISIAAAHVARALPGLVTFLAWRSCDHTGPVFEGDALGTSVTVEAVRPLAAGAIVDLRALVSAERAEGGGVEQVLDWRLVALAA